MALQIVLTALALLDMMEFSVVAISMNVPQVHAKMVDFVWIMLTITRVCAHQILNVTTVSVLFQTLAYQTHVQMEEHVNDQEKKGKTIPVPAFQILQGETAL